MIDPGELAALKGYCDLVRVAEELCNTQAVQDGGRRFRMACPFHAERTASLVLYPEQGTYHCYGCGAHGDVVRLAQERLSTDFVGAVRHLAQVSGYWPEGLADAGGMVRAKAVPPVKPLPRLKEDKRRKWAPVTPVPSKVPAPREGTFATFLHSADRHLQPARFWSYLDAAGQLLGCDVRYEYEKHPSKDLFRVEDRVVIDGARSEVAELLDGGRLLRLVDGRQVDAAAALLCVKDVITWTWCRHLETGDQEWRMRSWDDPSPLYGLDRLASAPTAEVLICEGCKAADAGHRLTGLPALSWRGGADTAKRKGKADWSPLAGRRVIVWPDADAPGRLAAWHVAQHARAAGASSVRVVDTSGLPKGWDLADV